MQLTADSFTRQTHNVSGMPEITPLRIFNLFHTRGDYRTAGRNTQRKALCPIRPLRFLADTAFADD